MTPDLSILLIKNPWTIPPIKNLKVDKIFINDDIKIIHLVSIFRLIKIIIKMIS